MDRTVNWEGAVMRTERITIDVFFYDISIDFLSTSPVF
jgi:hypothetical protein